MKMSYPLRTIVPLRSRLRETDRRLLSQHPEQMYVDKNGQRWYSEGPVQRRRDSANILRSSGGPTSTSVKDTKMETWQLFWSDDLLQKVLTYSQMKAGELGLPIRFTMASLKAYIAILYFRGANQDNKIPIDELWSEQYSTFYRTVMSRNLFKLWNRCLRFDDVSLREDRKKTDTYAAMREVWEEWNSRLKLFFEPTSCVCVDEQLVASRCRSPHRIYNPSKPGKFGELIRWCSDANDRYFLNGSPLTKRPEDRDALILHKEENKAKRLVTNLVAPYLDRGLNVTGDRFFTSLELAELAPRKANDICWNCSIQQKAFAACASSTERKVRICLCFWRYRQEGNTTIASIFSQEESDSSIDNASYFRD